MPSIVPSPGQSAARSRTSSIGCVVPERRRRPRRLPPRALPARHLLRPVPPRRRRRRLLHQRRLPRPRRPARRPQQPCRHQARCRLSLRRLQRPRRPRHPQERLPRQRLLPPVRGRRPPPYRHGLVSLPSRHRPHPQRLAPVKRQRRLRLRQPLPPLHRPPLHRPPLPRRLYRAAATSWPRRPKSPRKWACRAPT